MHVSVLSWHRRVWRLAGPIMFSSVSVPLLGAVDTAVVGHLPGAEYIGAVAVGTTIFNILFLSLGFLRMGTTGLTAQAVGAGDGDEMRAALARPFGLALAIACGLILFQLPLAWLAFKLFGASPAVEVLARDYFAVRIWAAPAMLANFVLLGWFIGMQRAGSVLALQLLMNGINVGLDFLFVFELGLGVTGVAWASLAAQYIALGIGLTLARHILANAPGAWRWELLRQADKFKRMLGINRDIFLRTISLSGCMSLLTVISARSGDTVLAANAILIHMVFISAYWLDGFAHAVSALAGSAYGAGDRDRFRTAVISCGGWALGVAATTSAVYILAGPWIIDLMTRIPAVREMAREFLPWVVVAPLYSVWSFTIDGIFVGATRAREMRNMAFLSASVFLVCAATLVPWLDNHGLWLSYFIFMLARALTLGSRYPTLERAVGALRN